MQLEIPELEVISDRIEFLTKTMQIMMERFVSPVMDIKDIARIEGVGVSTIYTDKYRHYLPNYGHSDFPEGKTRWKFETCERWRRIPLSERRQRWESMGRKDRLKIIGE